jgi:hypothetical protein
MLEIGYNIAMASLGPKSKKTTTVRLVVASEE